MADELKVSLGIREDGTVIHITEVDEATERGLGCNCICSECGDRLVARLGKVRQHHFAHHAVHDCVKSDESALHRFAKEVFQKHSRFKVPEAEVWWDYESKVISRALYVPYLQAVPEQPIGDIIPDITLVRDGRPDFLVEVLVTHEVDEVKSAKLEALGLPCVEIDLSHLYCGLEEFDRDAIEQLLIHGDGYEKTWACIPNAAQYVEGLKEKVRLAEEEERRKAEQARRDAERRDEWLKRSEEQRFAKQDALLRDESLAVADTRKEAELTAHPMWKRNSRILGIEASNIPFYLNVPLEGEYLFKCHRAIWQTTLFISWVFNKRDPERSRDIHINYVVNNLKEKHPELLELDLYWAHRERPDLRVLSLADVVAAYFGRLTGYGYTTHLYAIGGRNPYSWVYECLRSDVVTPPPQYNDDRFKVRDHGLVDSVSGEVVSF